MASSYVNFQIDFEEGGSIDDEGLREEIWMESADYIGLTPANFPENDTWNRFARFARIDQHRMYIQLHLTSSDRLLSMAEELGQ